MSNTVKFFDVTFDGPQNLDDLYAAVGKFQPPLSPISLVLDAMVRGDQVWTYNLIEVTLSYDWGTKLFALSLNNLVA